MLSVWRTAFHPVRVEIVGPVWRSIELTGGKCDAAAMDSFANGSTMTLRQPAAAVVEALRLVAIGGWLVALYLDYVLDPAVPAVHRLWNILMLSFWLLWMADVWLRPVRQRPAPLRDISAASSGAGVVLATGVAAALYLGRDFHRPDDLMIPAAILLFTAGIAVAVVRFARRHPGEIGEARFDTRNRDER